MITDKRLDELIGENIADGMFDVIEALEELRTKRQDERDRVLKMKVEIYPEVIDQKQLEDRIVEALGRTKP